MRFGLTAFPLGQMGIRLADASSADIVARLSKAADDLGFEFVTAQDHTLAPRDWAASGGGTMWHEPFTVLAHAAAVTTRVKLLTDVIILPYRSPFQTAKIAASLDDLSGGRLILGVAAGYLEEEFSILGAPFENRGAVTDEAIEAVKHAWTNEWTDFSGEFFTAKDVAVSPRPLQQPRPPIWVGGNSMRALRRAVEHADGWDPFRGSPDHIRDALTHAREVFGLDRPFDVAVPLRHGVYTADDRTLDVDSLLRQVDAYAESGVTHLKCGFHGQTLADYVASMELFSAQVINHASGGRA